MDYDSETGNVCHFCTKRFLSSFGVTNHMKTCTQGTKSREARNRLARAKLAEERVLKLKRKKDLALQEEMGTRISRNFTDSEPILPEDRRDNVTLAIPAISDASIHPSLQSSCNLQVHQGVANTSSANGATGLEASNDEGIVPQDSSPNEDPQVLITPQDTIQTASHRSRRLPKKFSDFLPTGISRIVRQIRDQFQEDPQPPVINHSLPPTPPILPRVRLLLPKWKSPLNPFRVFREYESEPTHIPDEGADLDNFLLPSAQSNISDKQKAKSEVQISAELEEAVSPFPNLTSFWFRKHHSDNAKSSKNCMDKLQQLITHPRFRSSDLKVFNREKVDQLLLNSVTDAFPHSKGWIKQGVDISVPLGKGGESATQTFTVEGFFYRKLVDVVRSSLEDESILCRFHFQPFKQFWQPHGSDSPSYERIYDEFYTSDAMIRENEKLQKSPREPGCNRERVLVSMLFASDATQLASFGQAKAWPVYLFYGNHSKYDRCKPTANLAEHIAFLPSLPDEIQDVIRETLGKAAGKPVITHCRRELMHGIWKILLDDEFIAAWKHGIVVMCFDGVERRFYLRIFTYSADYPEKVLLATIRDMGNCPCPRCLVEKKDIGQLGTVIDMRYRETRARVDNERRQSRVKVAIRYIHGNLRAGVTSTAVEDILKLRSEVPVVNAFSERLSPLGFDFHTMLVNDFLHEFELGEWKALFTHLIRILYAENTELVHELDARFRQVNPFGRDTIRPFHHNVSEMKKLAARDFEDILQCCIPVFEDLLPSPHNQRIRRFLFVCANLHALCKLRLHTETTLHELEAAVSRYGVLIRYFKTHVCTHFSTYETPKEVQARARKAGRKAAQNTKQGASIGTGITLTRPKKEFNLERYKLHAMGDYVATIRLFGTTESYSTQRSELQHTKVKAWFGRSSKNHTSTKQMTSMDVIERRLRVIDRRVKQILSFEAKPHHHTPKAKENQPQQHYEVSQDSRDKFTIGYFLKEHDGDPSVQYFWSHLMDHLFHRLCGRDEESRTTMRCEVIVKDNMLFRHAHARFNYTTYDIHRAQDSISMRSARRHVMVAANDPSDKHPFWYAQVLGIFHTFATVSEFAPENQKDSIRRVDFLWVRWLTLDHSWKGGFKQERLDRVSFVPDGPTAFGFVDPSDVIRACHLIPAFSKGRTKHLLDASFIRDTDGDFRYFFVNRFVDRDMYIRYRGDGIGHRESITRGGESRSDPWAESNEDEDLLNDPAASNVDEEQEGDSMHSMQGELRDNDSGSDEEFLTSSSSESDEDTSAELDEDGGEDGVIYDV